MGQVVVCLLHKKGRYATKFPHALWILRKVLNGKDLAQDWDQ